MTDQQINIAIAEACGWDFDPIECAEWGSCQSWCKSPHGQVVFRHNIPDYLNDLNAMHEAEVTLNYEQAEKYEDGLCDICDMENRHKEYPLPFRFAVAHASARQRAEVFLRTIEAWKEARSE